jgi:hypothetical protein
MKIDTAHLERNWSAWHSAVSQCTRFSIKHGDKCLLVGEAELVRDNKHVTLVFAGPKKAAPKPKRVKSVVKKYEIAGVSD